MRPSAAVAVATSLLVALVIGSCGGPVVLTPASSPSLRPSRAPSTTPGPLSASFVGHISYAAHSGLSPAYLVGSGQVPRQVAGEGFTTGVLIGSDVTCPTLSPDGMMLAAGMPGGTVVVVRVWDDTLGHRLGMGASETPHCPAWAPDSKAVAFLDGASLTVAPVDPEAGATAERRIEGWDEAGDPTDFLTDYPPDRAVQWSPDGTVIAVARPSGTWLVSVDGGAPRRLHRAPAFSVGWSPDGARLVIGTDLNRYPDGAPLPLATDQVAGAGPNPAALVIRISDGAVETAFPMGMRPPTWSPVDDRIAYSDPNAKVAIVRSDGADRTLIDDYGYNVTWSPDGRHVMFIQDVGMAWRLVIRSADGTGPAETVVPSVSIPSARSYPAAQQFSWGPGRCC